jgi:hypothetical protein
MKWSEIEYQSDHRFDENEKAVKGFFLFTIGIDLENIPGVFWNPAKYLDEHGLELGSAQQERVLIRDVIGSCYDTYSNTSWIQVFQRLKRASYYIRSQRCTPAVYKKQLKLPVADQWSGDCPISFIRLADGHYTYHNGNHRVTLYKMMYFAELSHAETDAEKRRIDRQYYVNAIVYQPI